MDHTLAKWKLNPVQQHCIYTVPWGWNNPEVPLSSLLLWTGFTLVDWKVSEATLPPDVAHCSVSTAKPKAGHRGTTCSEVMKWPVTLHRALTGRGHFWVQIKTLVSSVRCSLHKCPILRLKLNVQKLKRIQQRGHSWRMAGFITTITITPSRSHMSCCWWTVRQWRSDSTFLCWT